MPRVRPGGNRESQPRDASGSHFLLMPELIQDPDWYLTRLEGVEGSGGQWSTWCPCHDDVGTSVKGLSLTLKGNGKLYAKCWSCGATLPAVYEALSGEPLHDEDIAVNVSRVSMNGAHAEPVEIGNGMKWWISKTGVTQEVWESIGCYDHDGGVAFHFSDDYPIKIRKAPKEITWAPKHQEIPPLWPLPVDSLPEEVTITEGESDCGTAHAAGLPYAFSVTAGAKTNMPTGWATALSERGVKSVLVASDSDEAGVAMRSKLAREATAAGLTVKVIRLEDVVDPFSGITDLNGVWRACETKEEFLEIVERASVQIAERIPFISVKEMETLAEEEIRWIVPELIAPGDKILLSAPQKSLKSWIALDLTRSLTEKLPFLARPEWTPQKRYKVGFLQEEGSKQLWAIRVAMLRLNHKGYAMFAHKTGFKFTDPSYIDELIASVGDNDLDFLIFDPLQRMMPGVNENDPNEAGIVWDEIFRLQQAHPALVCMVIHHANKMQRLNWESARGSSRHGGEVDLGIFLDKDPTEDDTLKIWLDGRDIPQYVQSGEIIKAHYTLNRDERIFSIDATESTVNLVSSQDRKREENRKLVYDAIAAGDTLKKEIILRTELSDATIRTHVDALVESGDIKEEDNGKGKPKTYSVIPK